MKYLLRTLIVLSLIYFTGTVSAGITSVLGGYKVNYDINLYAGSSNGGDIQDTFIIEWNESNDFNIDYAYTIAGKGKTSISHVIGFKPTAALLIGYGLGVPGVGDEKDHIFTLTNASFAQQVAGLKWSEAFPGVPPASRIGHSAMINLLKDAATGDSASLDALKSFIESEAYQAGFDPAGKFSVMEWSTGQPVDVPVPIPTLSFWGLVLLTSLLGMIGFRRRRIA